MQFFRRVSNCTNDDDEESGEQGTGDNDGQQEEIVTPPDGLVTQEMAEGPQDLSEARALNSIQSAVKAVSSGIHLQETRKVRLTPAACQRQEMQNTMLSYIKKTTAENDDSSDDELDLAFGSIAKRMRLHLNKNQKEQVLYRIQNVVGDSINNVLEGMPVNGIQTNYRPQMQQNIMPPRQTSTPDMNQAAGDQMPFFRQGEPSISFNTTGDFSYQNL